MFRKVPFCSSKDSAKPLFAINVEYLTYSLALKCHKNGQQHQNFGNLNQWMTVDDNNNWDFVSGNSYGHEWHHNGWPMD